MIRLLSVLASAVIVTTAGVAVGQAPTLTIEVSPQGAASIALSSATEPDCIMDYFDEQKPMGVQRKSGGGWVPNAASVGYLTPEVSGDRSLPSIRCKVGESKEALIPIVAALPPVIRLATRVDPTSGLALSDWFIQALGTLEECKIDSSDCSLVGNRLQPGPSVEAGTLKATFKRGSATVLIQAQVETCRYALESPLGSLIQGAHLQGLRLAPLRSGCYSYIGSNRRALLKRDGATDIALAQQQDGGTGELSLALWLPLDTPLGKSEWSLEIDGASAGKVEGRVIATPKRVSDEIRVTYSEPALDQLQDKKSAKGVAVAVPEGAAGSAIRNSVRIDFPAELSGHTIGTSLRWQIAESSWGSDVQFYCADRTGKEVLQTPSATAPCTLRDSRSLEFAVSRRRVEPLEVQIALVREREAQTPVNSEAVPTFDALLRTVVSLANSAQVESIPFPAARVLSLQCSCSSESGDDCQDVEPIESGQTRGIGHNDLQESKCRAILDLSADRLSELGIKDSAIYGPQTLVVSVTPEGGVASTSRWEIVPTKDSTPTFRLPTPVSQASGGQFYTVEIKVAASQIAQVQYRAGTTNVGEVGDGGNVRRSELVYEARLRSRGVYGLGGDVRLFVTVPVELASVRFPARADELPDSDSSPNYQLVSPIFGILLGLEPWDYDSGRNKWTLPMRALAGVHAREVRDHLELALALGVAATLPIVDSPNELGSSLAVGTYYTLDLAPSGRSFKERQAFVLTLGFNIFSLFAGR